LRQAHRVHRAGPRGSLPPGGNRTRAAWHRRHRQPQGLRPQRLCTGSGKSSGTARLWFNDAAASSRFDATIAGTTRDYFLRTAFALTPGEGAIKQSLDAVVGPKCGAFVPFGTWTIVIP
jgi:hypothetical protein